MVEKLSVIKEESGRDLDALVDGDTLVVGETSAGVFGVFKFFQGIKNFFKGITALGTLATGSKILVTDDNGNISYTTPANIKSGLSLVNSTELNGALANQTEYNTTVKTDANECVPSVNETATYRVLEGGTNNPDSTHAFIITTTRVLKYSSRHYISQIAVGVLYNNNGVEYFREGVWVSNEITWGTWQKLITETDLNGALADLNKLKTVAKTDANDCIPSRANNIEYFAIAYNGSNLPNTSSYNYVIEVICRGDTQIFQNAYGTKSNTTIVHYQRSGTKSNDIWTWGSWEKVATDSDVSGALADYAKSKSYEGTVTVNGGYFQIAFSGVTSESAHKIFITSSYNGSVIPYFFCVQKSTDKFNVYVRKSDGTLPENGTSIRVMYMIFY